MDRPACVDLPALPLQLLLRRRPEWRGRPIAVVAEDSPSATILWVNEKARARSVQVGGRHGAALALVADLRAAPVEDEEIRAATTSVAELLVEFTPRVEPVAGEPGLFHLDASGLSRMWPSPADWGRAIRRRLAREELRATVVVGFTRFGVFAVARSTRGLLVFDDPAAETEAVRAAPLPRLAGDPTFGEAMRKLDVRTVGDLLALPARGLRVRFGPEAERLLRLARDDFRESMRPLVAKPPLSRSVQIEHPETDAARLLFLAKRLVDSLVADAVLAGEAVVEIEAALGLDDGGRRVLSVRPAAPTLDAPRLMDLLRLRFETMRREEPLRQGVTEMTLLARGVRVRAAQQDLFARRPRRDPAAAERAFARLRAEFGEDAVVVARPADRRLPEESFVWERLDRLPSARRRIVPHRALVRRIYAKPLPVPPPADPARLSPPDRLDTRWWTHEPVLHEEHFSENPPCGFSWLRHVLGTDSWLLLGDVR